MKLKCALSRHFCQQILERHGGEIDAMGSIKMIQDLIACIDQGCQCSFLRKIVDVPHTSPLFENRRSAKNCLHGEIQRDMEYFELSFFPQPSQETQIIFNVLEYIDRQDDIKVRFILKEQIAKMKMQPLLLFCPTQMVRLRRDFVSGKRHWAG